MRGRSRAAACVLFLLLLLIAHGVQAASVDVAFACVDANGFEFDASVSQLEEGTVIFRIGADSDPFDLEAHRISVEFDGASGEITSAAVVEDTGAEIQRWATGPIDDFALTPVREGAWRLQGRVGHGPQQFEVGEAVWGFVLFQEITEDSDIVRDVPLEACADAEPPPEVIGELNLTGAPGTEVSAPFAVDGAFPIALSADLGSVEPAVLNEAGDATYLLDIDAQTEFGAIVEDTITLSDAAGNTQFIAVTVEVVPPERDIALIEMLTPNERSLALFFDNVCPRIDDEGTELEQDLREICARLRDPDNTEQQIAAALEAINPEELMASLTAALRLTRVQHGNLAQRINALRSGALGRSGESRENGVDVSGLTLRIDGRTIPGAAFAAALDGLRGGGASADDVIGGRDFGRWGLFANGTINFGDRSRTANEAGFDFDTQGITAGIDYRVRDNAFVGFALGYARVDVGFDRRGGNMDIDSWNMSLFGTYFHEDRYYVDALVNYGRNDYDSVRHIRFTDAQGEVDRTARASTLGKQISFSLAGGYDFNLGPWTVGPHVGTDFIDADVNRLRERGAGALDMTVESQSQQSWTLNGGAHASYAYTAPWGVLIPHLRLDFVRELKTGRETLAVRLAADPFSDDPTDPSPTITLQGDRPDRGYFVFSTGASAQFIRGFAGFVNYQRMAGMKHLKMSQINLGLRVERQF